MNTDKKVGPFLQVLTRCWRRPHMLMVNMASLCAQSDPDWEQTLLVDTVGRGVPAAQRALAEMAPRLRGEYIWVLDDDDVCVRPGLVAELKEIIERYPQMTQINADKSKSGPDVIMVRMDHGKEWVGVQPDDKAWMQPPRQGRIGCSAFVVRREVWQAHADHWGEHYAGDYEFIASVWAQSLDVYWYDVVASRVQRVSHGATEN